MNEKNEKLTPEQMAAIETAKRQGKISEKEMSKLVKSTLEQFLLGEFEFEDGGDEFIIYRAYNGQTFLIGVMDYEEREWLKKEIRASVDRTMRRTAKS